MEQANGKTSENTVEVGFARPDLIVALCLLVVVVSHMVWVASAPVVDLTFRSTDDSYYYFKVAENVVSGNGLTFDGINRTNGFHPLWMACLFPIYAIFGSDPVVALRAVYFLVTLIAGGSYLIAYGGIRRWAGRWSAVIGLAALPSIICLNPMLNGLETGLLILLLFLLIRCIAAYDLLSVRADFRRNALFGVLLAAVFLCRLDSMFIILALLVSYALRWLLKKEEGASFADVVRKTVQTGMVSAAFVVPYLAFNVLEFGHLMPISGALKTTFPNVSFEMDRLTNMQAMFGLVPLVGSGLCLILLAGDSRVYGRDADWGWRGSLGEILIACWVGCLLHFVNTILFMSWAVHWWHFASYVPLAIVSASLVFGRFHGMVGRSNVLGAAAVVVVLALSIGSLVADAKQRGSHHGPWYEAALWIADNLPEDAVVGMTDCGIVGYFCDRRTVNLDGVINGIEFQDALRDHKLDEYLQRCGVTHICDYEVHYTDGRYRIRLPSRLHKTKGCTLWCNEAAEVYGSEAYRPYNKSKDIHFAIWSLSGVDIENVDESTGGAPSGV